MERKEEGKKRSTTKCIVGHLMYSEEVARKKSSVGVIERKCPGKALSR